ncbi:MAG TPA: transposase [Candidatus Acidoferrum sp.]|nr:transposase [Candidatus Acidoferrum sp.]
MTSTKYIGMDVHKESISIAVMNSGGKVVMECVIETKASTIVQFIDGLRGDLRVTFEEGTCAAWLHDLLKPHVTEVVVCNPRKIALLKDGSKSDRIDARKLAEQLYMNKIKPVYHGEHGLRTLKELARSYLTISKDLTRVMNRLKALYRSWGIPCAGNEVYAPRHRSEWLSRISETGVRRRAEHYYQQLDALRSLRQEVRRDLLLESKKHKAWKLLRQIPGIGPIRAALIMAILQTPHRFRTKRQLWTYSGLGLETHDSAQYEVVEGQLQRSKKPVTLRGLNKNHNHDLKDIFKGAAMRASTAAGPFRDFYEALLAKGRRPTMARLTLARKIAATTLIIWKKEVRFDATELKPQAA